VTLQARWRPGRHVLDKRLTLVGELSPDITTHGETVRDDFPHSCRQAIGAAQVSSVVMSNETADGDAAIVVEERKHCLPDGAANVLEVDINTLGAGGRELVGKAARTMVHNGIETEFILDKSAFRLAAPRRPRSLQSGTGGEFVPEFDTSSDFAAPRSG
jgi:hypothetical protein